MRLWILSDLHLGHGAASLPLAIPDADVAILAGDLCEGLVEAIAWSGRMIRPRMPVVQVAGNHEFYGREPREEIERGRRAARELGVFFLDEQAEVIGGVRFVGCTLWTDYALGGPEQVETSMALAAAGLRDHSAIRWRGRGLRRFQPPDAAALHGSARAFLDRTLQAPHAGPSVVVTHHAPSARSIAPRWEGDPLNPAFASALDGLIEKARPALWVHGHMHSSLDYRLGATRVVANARGFGSENPGFDPALVLEV